MNDLATIKKLNRPAESRAAIRRARALNAGCKGHAKAYEKLGAHTGRLNTRVNVQPVTIVGTPEFLKKLRRSRRKPEVWRITECGPYQIGKFDFSDDLI